MMQMIPFFGYPNHRDVGLPPSAFPCDSFDAILSDDFSAFHDTEFEMIATDADPINPDEFLSLSADSSSKCYSKFLLYDCNLSDCLGNPECAKTHDDDFLETAELYNPQEIFGYSVTKPPDDIQPYTPDSDHCYSAPANKQILTDMDDKLGVLKNINIPTPPSTSESPSDISSEEEVEVDVVTVPEEYPPPVVITRFEVPRKSGRPQKNARKSQRTQNTLSAKSLKAAMKRTRVQNIHRTYRRRKLYNSVETTPSSSIPSSSQSSRCSSDVEDLDKRENHNCSERKRREAQRTALQNLRMVIPDLSTNPKAPKVLILNSATSLCQKLGHNNWTLKELKLRELKKNSDLKARYNQLRLGMKAFKG